ncbi:CDP-diacylglycerol--glycerol-3-phosphate 3-phosphatidyltransferase, mitochondrial, partial [Galemys pyrenaicus]
RSLRPGGCASYGARARRRPAVARAAPRCWRRSNPQRGLALGPGAPRAPALPASARVSRRGPGERPRRERAGVALAAAAARRAQWKPPRRPGSRVYTRLPRPAPRPPDSWNCSLAFLVMFSHYSRRGRARRAREGPRAQGGPSAGPAREPRADKAPLRAARAGAGAAPASAARSWQRPLPRARSAPHFSFTLSPSLLGRPLSGRGGGAAPGARQFQEAEPERLPAPLAFGSDLAGTPPRLHPAGPRSGAPSQEAWACRGGTEDTPLQARPRNWARSWGGAQRRDGHLRACSTGNLGSQGWRGLGLRGGPQPFGPPPDAGAGAASRLQKTQTKPSPGTSGPRNLRGGAGRARCSNPGRRAPGGSAGSTARPGPLEGARGCPEWRGPRCRSPRLGNGTREDLGMLAQERALGRREAMEPTRWLGGMTEPADKGREDSNFAGKAGEEMPGQHRAHFQNARTRADLSRCPSSPSPSLSAGGLMGGSNRQSLGAGWGGRDNGLWPGSGIPASAFVPAGRGPRANEKQSLLCLPRAGMGGLCPGVVAAVPSLRLREAQTPWYPDSSGKPGRDGPWAPDTPGVPRLLGGRVDAKGQLALRMTVYTHGPRVDAGALAHGSWASSCSVPGGLGRTGPAWSSRESPSSTCHMSELASVAARDGSGALELGFFLEGQVSPTVNVIDLGFFLTHSDNTKYYEGEVLAGEVWAGKCFCEQGPPNQGTPGLTPVPHSLPRIGGLHPPSKLNPRGAHSQGRGTAWVFEGAELRRDSLGIWGAQSCADTARVFGDAGLRGTAWAFGDAEVSTGSLGIWGRGAPGAARRQGPSSVGGVPPSWCPARAHTCLWGARARRGGRRRTPQLRDSAAHQPCRPRPAPAVRAPLRTLRPRPGRPERARRRVRAPPCLRAAVSARRVVNKVLARRKRKRRVSMAAAAAGPVFWRRLLGLLPGRPGLAALLGRLSDRLGRNRDRRPRRSPWLLLAPLLSPTVPQVTSPPCCLCPEGVHRFQWIRNLVPEFGVSSSHVRVLSSPAEFFELMKGWGLGLGECWAEVPAVQELRGCSPRPCRGVQGRSGQGQIRVAKRRVVMASLYLGTGPLEQELVDCLESALEKSLQARFPSDLKVSILLDFTRGSRGRKNSRTMLLPLLQRFPEQVRVSLFHTPHLRGLLRLLIPERFNETIGLQHIKVYLFDNSVILSGCVWAARGAGGAGCRRLLPGRPGRFALPAANLSDSYFTNRQDRYVFLQDCPEVADFFTELVDAVGDVSLQLQGDNTVQVVEGMVHPYKGDRAAYCKAAHKRVMDVIESARTRQQMLHAQTFHGDSLLAQEDAAAAGDRRPAPDTWIYPLIQMKPFEIQIDELVTETLLTEAERGARVHLTTGYFNLTQAYMDLVLGTRAEYRILLASPEVNGFFGARGVAGAIPAAYMHIERQFYSEVCGLGQQERVQLQEYWRRGWTFHAKGLWLYLAGSSLPCLTLIGSPNFGYRSVHRDLEAQIAVVTESQALQQQLHQEQEQLYLRSGVVSAATFEQPSRRVKLWVRMVTPLIKNFF